MQFFVRKLHGQACGVPRASRAVPPVFSNPPPFHSLTESLGPNPRAVSRNSRTLTLIAPSLIITTNKRVPGAFLLLTRVLGALLLPKRVPGAL